MEWEKYITTPPQASPPTTTAGGVKWRNSRSTEFPILAPSAVADLQSPGSAARSERPLSHAAHECIPCVHASLISEATFLCPFVCPITSPLGRKNLAPKGAPTAAKRCEGAPRGVKRLIGGFGRCCLLASSSLTPPEGTKMGQLACSHDPG